MYFKRIELQGFKSFADPVSIEFNDGITAIVGPNGSGKSNISDAIRWVLGEQSPKALRGGQMSEVIFAGTANKKPRGMAEVTLVIDNEKGTLPIDFSEVAITRRMFRSGESEYAINGRQCRLRDVRELIMDTGIGVDGYSIIGQGKITEIISGKPESRRAIFEEAAGVVMYRTKKAEAERKLESTAINLERANDIVRELESRIPSLMEDSTKAKEYLELKERYKTLEVNITLNNIDAVELKNEFLNDELMELSATVDDIKEKKDELDESISEARGRNAELEKLISESTDKLLASIEEINRITNKSELNSEKLAAFQRDDKRLADEIEGIETRLAAEKKNAEALFESRAELEKKLAGLREELAKKTEEYGRLSAEYAEAQNSASEKKEELFDLQRKKGDKEAEIKSLESMKDALDRRRQRILEERESESGESERTDRLDALKRERAGLEERFEKLKAEQTALRKKYNESLLEEKSLSAKSEAERLKLGQLSERRRTIQEMENNYEGYNGAVRFIMRSGLSGIRGVVADLIKTPQGYELAIETALGQALQNMVCDDDASAKNAINLLKENRAGRLTFLPISSMRPRKGADEGLATEKGFVGFGTDCIEFEPIYRPVMEYLLNGVVVMDRLDNAIRASKRGGAARFVTLEGEIINAGGAISGGAYKNKTANLLERKAEIAKLSEEIERRSAEEKKAGEKLGELRTFLNGSQEEMQRLGEKLRALEIELVESRGRLSSEEEAIKDFESARARTDRELASIAEESANSDKLIEKLREEISAISTERVETEKAIQDANALAEEKKKAADLGSEEITKARMAANSCENEKISVDTIAGRIEEEMEGLLSSVNQKQAERERISRERERLLSEQNTAPEDIEQKQYDKEALERYIDEITAEKAKLNRFINESSLEKEELSRTLEKQQDAKYQAQTKLDRNNLQLENSKNKLWEEFEISYAQALGMRAEDFDMNAAVRENRGIKSRLRELGDINLGSIKEYDAVSERYRFLKAQRDDIQEAANALKKIISDMDKTIKERFRESFDSIAINFEAVFRELFGGGHAELRLENEESPLEGGVDITAQPPGKKLQNINLMSGGEKTMTAIALMFAVLKSRPTPFCILDEVEAALDDANIRRFAKYLRNFEEIQFALITHQKVTMEHADVLYGVTMPEQGISKLISLRLGDRAEGVE